MCPERHTWIGPSLRANPLKRDSHLGIVTPLSAATPCVTADPPLRPHTPYLRPSPSKPLTGAFHAGLCDTYTYASFGTFMDVGEGPGAPLRGGERSRPSMAGQGLVHDFVPCTLARCCVWVGLYQNARHRMNVHTYPWSLAPHTLKAEHFSYVWPAAQFGDHEARRHWMELASHLPLRETVSLGETVCRPPTRICVQDR